MSKSPFDSSRFMQNNYKEIRGKKEEKKKTTQGTTLVFVGYLLLGIHMDLRAGHAHMYLIESWW